MIDPLILKTMLSLLKQLPVELMGMNVLGYLSMQDIAMLERACGSKKSHLFFLDLIPYCSPVVLPTIEQSYTSVINWFVNRQCKIRSLMLRLPGDNPCLHAMNLKVEYFDLHLESLVTIETLKPVQEQSIACIINCLYVNGNQKKEVIKQLCVCTGNIEKLKIKYSNNCMDWLTVDILLKWKLKEIYLRQLFISNPIITLIVQTCRELSSIDLDTYNIDDTTVIEIAKNCPKLETLVLHSSNQLTYTSLLALSERGLPLKELYIIHIPNIPIADIARRCSHALSCTRHLHTCNLTRNGKYASIFIPYLTGLTNLMLGSYGHEYLPLLIQYCNKLTNIAVYDTVYTVSDILSLCRANPLLLHLYWFYQVEFTDTALIELIHACPHLHILDFISKTEITDIGILALSEHCPQLQELTINKCDKVTEAAVLQLLQRCRKLTRLYVSSSSLSEETWTQLDSNIQKRVSRW